MDFLLKLHQSMSALDYVVIVGASLLFIFAQPIVKRFSSGSATDKILSLRIYLFRGFNLVFLLVYGYYHFNQGSHIAFTALAILAVLFLANISNYLFQYLIHKHYGKAREIGDRTIYIETYQSRLLSILTVVFTTVLAIVAIVNLLGFNSLLEAGGVIGIIGVFLGLTQSSWAPDIISGLIILNSDMFEEGDIIEIDDGLLGRIYKTKLFHTEILNISNNHRVMLRNARLREHIIHNLSKFASARGLRECLSFKIDYNVDSARAKAMFEEAYKKALEMEIPIESNIPIEVKVLETGDHAVTWGVLYHIKKVEKIVSIRRDFRELILDTSKAHGISLATPLTHVAIQ